MEIQPQRLRTLNSKFPKPGPIVYWMSRDQRVHDNWALLHSQNLAISQNVPLVVFFCVPSSLADTNKRQLRFMLRGLEDIAATLRNFQIQFVVKSGMPGEEIVKFARDLEAGVVVTDFSPLRECRQSKEHAARELALALVEVDAHNIVPCWVASPKQEYAAYTFRPKINKLLPQFLVEFQKVKVHPVSLNRELGEPNFEAMKKAVMSDVVVKKDDWITPGESAAKRALKSFIANRLANYNDRRNNPGVQGQSDLSPYLHFGQISAQRVALSAISACPPEVAASFLEELIVRRELSDNFCFYNLNYDNVDGFPDWAKRTLRQHEHDVRPYLYTLEQLEAAATHDDIWNQAQTDMVNTGKMHGYLRMYWAKKILEWTRSPKEALQYAIYLNDKYELDGLDPNGYCGVAWSIGGVHDRAWFDRPVFGMVRYMGYKGCKSKFKS